MSASSLESGYNSSGEEARFQPLPDKARIEKDAIRLQDEFEISELLMKSANGMIYSGRILETGRPVIFKQIPRYSVAKWSKFDDSWIPLEIALHFQAYNNSTNSHNIVEPITWLEKNSSFVLVMEKVPNCMDLFDLVKNYGALTEEAACIIFTQLLDIIKSLEQAGISHRDIKDENLIVNVKTLDIKLIDFGCATLAFEGDQFDFSGTPEFYPPEFWRQRVYRHQPLGIWQIGIVLVILLTGNLPITTTDEIAKFDINKLNLLSSFSPATSQVLQAALAPLSDRASSDKLTELLLQWRATLNM